MRWWLLGIGIVLAQWGWSAYVYRWVWGRPLRFRYWPGALGFLLARKRAVRWEVPLGKHERAS